MDEKNLFLIDNIIAHTEFNSVVNISIGLKEYEWLEVFLEKYRKYIDPGFAKDIYNLACAKLYFQRKKYDELFKYLINVEFKDPVYYYNAKFILGRVYYEQKNINGARYIISNLRQYMRTKKSLTSEQINAIIVFNHYMGQLVKVFECNSKEVGSLKVILKKELDNEKKLVPNKDWFYESLSNIK